jgi:hypothetical protein
MSVLCVYENVYPKSLRINYSVLGFTCHRAAGCYIEFHNQDYYGTLIINRFYAGVETRIGSKQSEAICLHFPSYKFARPLRTQCKLQHK